MTPGWSRRAGAVLALVLAALFASAFVIGRALVLHQPQHGTAGLTRDLDDPRQADQPGSESFSSATGGGRSPDPTAAGQDGAARDAVGGGPFGAQVTTGSRQVALTFDDGPDPRYTPQVLAVLRAFGVRATFCLVGENAQKYPDLVRAIAAGGHTLCNHSWQHDVSLGRRSLTEIRADLLRTSAAIRAAVPDARIVWYRQPGGVWTRAVVSVAHELGMASLHWTVDPSDWQVPGAGRIAAAVISRTEPGSIVLLHDGGGNRQGTVDALRRILPDLTTRCELEPLPTQAR